MVVVREANGTLRKADFQEREKVLEVYYPKPGRSLAIPPMFEPANLEVHLRPIRL
jgi:small subunit ribosomal protein S22